MTMMDERVAERRRGVSEDKARRRLRWVLGLLAVVLVAAGSIWLVRSPLLSIDTVEVTGAVVSDPGAAVIELDMGVGTPTIDIDSSVLSARILEDPWVASVRVSVVWPSRLVIDVVERVPVAPVQAGDAWVLVAADGAIVAGAPAPDPAVPLVAIDLGDVGPGDVTDDPMVIGALAFVGATAPDLRDRLRLRTDGGALVAEVSGHVVILGRPRAMVEKARVVEAVLSDGVEPGAVINVVAPSRPAVTNPQPEPEVEE